MRNRKLINILELSAKNDIKLLCKVAYFSKNKLVLVILIIIIINWN